MKDLSRRLRRLEDQLAPAIEALHQSTVTSEPSPLEWITQKLDEWGIVRVPNESLMETFARALGWDPRQLQRFLKDRAAGLQ